MKKNRRTFSWISPKVETRKTANKGDGIFAREDIKKGEIIAISGGFILTSEECERLPIKLQDYFYQVEKFFYIGPKNFDLLEDNYKFNHSCEPNAGNKGQLTLVSMRKIKKDEEITFDYAQAHYHVKGTKPWKIKCECGKSTCRKIVTEDDWKIPRLQNKYKGYFVPFIEEEIKKINKKQK
ncbi:MAG TPA: SET domain-containing protein [Candidatus Moranbacteria bacterium]|nr:SET domain-containing protein [Candidatus Moranbacteria bacterium]HRZ33312.1 SET domain-containing protein [Candidatus Moranbacteria bacterium]